MVQQAGTLVKQAGDRIQLQRTVLVQRDHPQLRPHSGAQHLPRHDIGVVLHRADDDVVARADVGVSPAVRHEVNAFRGAANKHQFLRRAGVEERRRPLAHLLHSRRSFRAEGMNAAMHRRIAVAVKFRLGVNHRFRLLRAGGAVEVGQRLVPLTSRLRSGKSARTRSTENVMPYLPANAGLYAPVSAA